MFKAKQKIVSFLLSFTTMLVTMLLAFSVLVGTPMQSASAETKSYVKVTTEPTDWSGEYLIVYEAENMAFDGSLDVLDAVNDYQAVNIKNNTISINTNISFTVEKSGTTYTIKSASGYYIGQTSDANGLKSSTSTSYANTLSINSDGNVNIVSGGAYLRFNTTSGQDRFRYYKSSSYTNQKAITLYKLEENTCEHTNQETTHTYNNDEKSHTSIITCKDCKAELESKSQTCEFEETIITSATNDQSGLKECKCKICKGSYQATIPALNATKHTVKYYFGSKEVGAEEVAEGDFPTFSVAEVGDEGVFKFIGWTTELTSKTETKPIVYTVGSEYEIKENTSFYALYEKSGVQLVTDASQLKAGNKIIIAAKDSAFALSTTQKSSNRGQAAITKSGNTVTFGSDVQFITLEAGTVDDTFAFYVTESKDQDNSPIANGYLYAASSGSNHLKTQTTKDNNASWKVEIAADGTASIVAQGAYTRNVMQYNQSSSLFSCYASASQKAICIYTVGETYYTSIPAKIASASITAGTSFDVNYYVTMDEAFKDATLKVSYTGKSAISQTLAGAFDEEKGAYKFTFKDVAPQYMTAVLTAKLVFNGETLATNNEFSIRAYAEYLLGKEDSTTELKTLVYNMLAYGAAAQEYTNTNMGSLANADYESEASTATPPKTNCNLEHADVEEYPAYFTGASVWFDNVNKIAVKLNTTENVKLIVSCGDEKQEYTNLESNVFMTDGILATDFDKVFTFELYHNGTLMQTLTYSVNTYAYNMQNNATVGALVKALYNYGVSAENYVG